jgi:hypothetical protein
MYTEERAMEVRRRVRENGERLTAVCADMGMNFENFLRWCRRNHFKVHNQASRKRSRELPRAPYPIGEKVATPRIPRVGGRAEAIVKDWREGKLAPTEIAAKHGVGYVYTIRLRKLVGLNPPAGKGRNIKNPNQERKTVARDKQIMQELARGRTPAEVGQEFDLSRQSIYSVRKRMNQSQ